MLQGHNDFEDELEDNDEYPGEVEPEDFVDEDPEVPEDEDPDGDDDDEF